MRVGSNVALPPASRQQAEAAALALFDRSEPTAEASPSLNTTADTTSDAGFDFVMTLFYVDVGIVFFVFLCCFCWCEKNPCDVVNEFVVKPCCDPEERQRYKEEKQRRIEMGTARWYEMI